MSRHPVRNALRVLVAGALALGALAWGAAAPVQAAPGGRVELAPAMRTLDTRITGRVTTTPLGSGVLDAYVVDSSVGGTATVHPCSAAVPTEPTLTFETGEVVYTKIIMNDACLTASTPVHVVVDRLGSLSASPSGSGLQYVPLPSGRVAFDEVVSAPPGESRGFALGAIPAEARAAVVLIEANDPVTAGHVRLDPCSRRSPKADMSWQNDRSVGVSYLDVTSGDVCLFVVGEARLRLTVLGFLSVDGPDPTRLPPTLSAPLAGTRLPGLRAITPVRLVDTRDGTGVAGARKLASGETLELELSELAAESTTAVAMNVTVTEPDAEGYLTVFPCDQNRPRASNLNYATGETVPNLVNVKISVTETVCFFAQRSTHLIVDLAGTYEAGGGAGVQPVAPVRLLDTRRPIGVPAAAEVAAGEVVTLQVAGVGGVPASGASAVTMNVTVTEPDRGGFVTVYPCDRARPTASNLNYTAGQTVPNLVSVRLSAAGTVCLFTQQTTHLIADLAAWYAVDQDDGFRELAPDRLLDTRESLGVTTAGKVPAGGQVVLQVAGRTGVPTSGATAVTMNVTVTEAEGDGFVTVFPCDTARPEASNLNFVAGETVPNLVTVQLAADGTVCLFAQRSVHLVADVAGYFTEATELRNVPTLG